MDIGGKGIDCGIGDGKSAPEDLLIFLDDT